MCRQRNLLILLLAAAITFSVVADVDVSLQYGGAPAAAAVPRAHELDNSYSFEQYLSHFGKQYDNLDEYARRSRTFSKNLKKILAHNTGKMTENGDILQDGYVMGVNMFTDFEHEELPMGYNKVMHPSWRVQFEERQTITKIERLLGGTASYSVSENIDSLLVRSECAMCVTLSLILRLRIASLFQSINRNHLRFIWTMFQTSPLKSTGQKKEKSTLLYLNKEDADHVGASRPRQPSRATLQSLLERSRLR